MIGAVLAKLAVRSGFEAMNRGDLDRFLNTWSDDAIWEYPGELKVSGRFEGKTALRGWFEHFFKQFPKRRFTVRHLGVDRIFAVGASNVIAAHWDLALTNVLGEPWQAEGVTLLTIRGAKVVHGKDFLFRSGGDAYREIWGEGRGAVEAIV